MPITDPAKQAQFEAYQRPAPMVNGRGRDEKAHTAQNGGAALLGAAALGGAATLLSAGLAAPAAMAVIGAAAGYKTAVVSRNQKFQAFYESLTPVERKEVQDELKANPEILLNLFQHTNEVGSDDPSALGAYLLAGPPNYALAREAEGAKAIEHKALSDVLIGYLRQPIQTLSLTPDDQDALTAVFRVRDLYVHTDAISKDELCAFYQEPMYKQVFTLLELNFDLATLCGLLHWENAFDSQKRLLQKIFLATIANIKEMPAGNKQAAFDRLVQLNQRYSTQDIGDQLTALVSEDVASLLANRVTYDRIHALLGNDSEGKPVIQVQLMNLLNKISNDDSQEYILAHRDADFHRLCLAIHALPAAQQAVKTALTDAVKAALPGLYADRVSLRELYAFSPEHVTTPKSLLSFIEAKPDAGIAGLWHLGYMLRHDHELKEAVAAVPTRAPVRVVRNQDAEKKAIVDAVKDEANARVSTLLDAVLAEDDVVQEENENAASIKKLAEAFYDPLNQFDLDELIKSKALALATKGYGVQKVFGLFGIAVNDTEFYDAALNACTSAADFDELIKGYNSKSDEDRFKRALRLQARKLVAKGVPIDEINVVVGIEEQVKAELKAINNKVETTDAAEIEKRNDDFLAMVKHFQSLPDNLSDERDAAMTAIVAKTGELNAKGILITNIQKAAPTKVTHDLIEKQIADSELEHPAKKEAVHAARERSVATGEYLERLQARMKTWINKKRNENALSEHALNQFEAALNNLPANEQERLMTVSSYQAFLRQHADKPSDSDEVKNTHSVLRKMTRDTMAVQKQILVKQVSLIANVLADFDAGKTMAELLVADGAIDLLFKDQDEVAKASGEFEARPRLRGDARFQPIEKEKKPKPIIAAGGAASSVFATPVSAKDSAILMEAEARKFRQHLFEDKLRVDALKTAALANQDGTAAYGRREIVSVDAAHVVPVAPPADPAAPAVRSGDPRVVNALAAGQVAFVARDAALDDDNSSAFDFHNAASGLINEPNAGALKLIEQARQAQEEAKAHAEWSLRKHPLRSADERRRAMRAVDAINNTAMDHAEESAAQAFGVFAKPLSSEVSNEFLQQDALRKLQAEINSVVVDTAADSMRYRPNGDEDEETIDSPERLKEQLQLWQTGLKRLQAQHKAVDVLQSEECFNEFIDAYRHRIVKHYKKQNRVKQHEMEKAIPVLGAMSSSYAEPFKPVREDMRLAEVARTKNHGLIASLIQLTTQLSAIEAVFKNTPKSVSMYVTLKLLLGGDTLNSVAYQFLNGKQDEVKVALAQAKEESKKHYFKLKEHNTHLILSGYEYGESSGFTRYFSESARKRKAQRDGLKDEIAMQHATMLQLEELERYFASATPDDRFRVDSLQELYTDSKAEVDNADVASITPFNGYANCDDSTATTALTEAAGFGGGVAAKNKAAVSNKIDHFIDDANKDLVGGSWRRSYFKATTVHRAAGQNEFYLRPQITSWNPRAETDNEGGLPSGKRNRLGVSMEMLSMKLQSVMISNKDALKGLDGDALLTERQRLIKNDISIIYKNPNNRSDLREMTIVNLAVGAHLGIFDLTSRNIPGLDMSNQEHNDMVAKAIVYEKGIDDTVKRSSKLKDLMVVLKQHAQPEKLDDVVKEVERAIFRPLASV